MVANYVLIRFLFTVIMLFLESSTQKNRGLVPFGKAAVFLLVLALISLALPSSIQAPAPNFGRIMAGNACFYETALVAHINQSPCTIMPNADTYINFTNRLAIPAKLTLSFDADALTVLSFQKFQNVTKSFLNQTNQTSIVHANGTVEKVSNFTIANFNVAEWVEQPRISFAYDARSWDGVNVQLDAKSNSQFKIRLSPKQYGGSIKYSLLGNASGVYAELDPVLNATAFNITGNSDLNLTVSTARFVDGKLILGQGNLSNLSGYDSFADNEFLTNPAWQSINVSRTDANSCKSRSRVGAENGYLNVTSESVGTNWCEVVAYRNVNLSESCGFRNGCIVRAEVDTSVLDSGASTRAGFCLFAQFDKLVNATATQHCMGETAATDNVLLGSFGGDYAIWYVNNGALSTPAGFGTADSGSVEEWTAWTNCTHAQFGINVSKAGSLVSGLQSLGALGPRCGSYAASFFVQTSNPLRQIAVYNFSVANATQFGQPLNFTPARFQTNVLNTTITATRARITNQTGKYANSAANWYVFDANHANLQNVTEGNSNPLTLMTGVGLNATFFPTLTFATELTSVLAQWNVQNTAPATPAFDRPANNSFFNTSQVTFNVTGIDADGDAITRYWYVRDAFNTTTTTNLTLKGLNDGNYSIRVASYDGTAFSSNSTLLNFTVDTVAPSVSLIANTPADNFFSSSDFVFVNTSENDAGNDHNDFSAFIDFNNSLVGYWRFEDGSGTSASDASSNGYTGTLNNFAGCASLNCDRVSGWTSAGKRGGGLAFDGLNDYVNITLSNGTSPGKLNISGNLTVEAWVIWYNSSAGAANVVSAGTGWFIERAGSNLNTMRFYINNDIAVTTSSITFGVWTHLVGVFNGSHTMVYQNGNRDALITLAAGYGGINNTNFGILIGSRYLGDGGRFFNGTVDEVKIWNRALSADEINASYSAGTYRLFRNFTGLSEGNYSYRAYSVDAAANINQTSTRNFTIDTTLPKIDNGSNSVNTSRYTKNNYAYINYTYSEINNPTLLIRNSTGGTTTNTTPSTTQATYFTNNFTALREANYTFSGWINDSAGNTNSTTNISVTVDQTPPNITLNSNLDLNNTALARNFIQINLSIAETYGDNITVSLTNSTTVMSTSSSAVNTTPSSNFYNFTGLRDGRYNLTVNVTDKAGNENVTANLTFLIDATPPIIENGSVDVITITAGNPFKISVNISEVNVENVTVTVSGANYSMTRTGTTNRYTYDYTTAAGIATTYTVTKFYINDTAGNTALNTTSLSVSATVPGTAVGVGGGGGGGGGGGITVINATAPGLTIITNASFQVKPSSVNSYANYFTTAQKPVTKRWILTANQNVKACNVAAPFECNINSANKLEAELKISYTQDSFSKVFQSQSVIISDANTATIIPIRVQSFNLGASLPLTIPRPEAISALYPSAFFENLPEGSKPRAILLAGLMFAPTLAGSYKGLLGRIGLRRRKKE